VTNDDENIGTETPEGFICEGCAAEVEEMKDINEWYADKCGVIFTEYEQTVVDGSDEKITLKFAGYRTDSFECKDSWTIQDPRCREIIREKFNIQTQQLVGEWMVICAGIPTQITSGKTIAEAEIACLEAIYKAEVEK
jgi:hypothetical protein